MFKGSLKTLLGFIGVQTGKVDVKEILKDGSYKNYWHDCTT